jgi:hypothetical protein
MIPKIVLFLLILNQSYQISCEEDRSNEIIHIPTDDPEPVQQKHVVKNIRMF